MEVEVLELVLLVDSEVEVLVELVDMDVDVD